jgi:pimeloyl-ACP methyl ester carboxylesterase
MTRWAEFARTTALAAAWDLLRLDLRGNARSLHRGRIGHARWCADLAAVLDAEGYARAVVAGHCLGANVAVEFARRHPERVAGLVLIEPMPREALRGNLRLAARLAPLVAALVPLVLALNALGLHRRRVPILDLEAVDRETRRALAGPETQAGALARHVSLALDLRTTPTATYLQSLLAVGRGLPDLSTIRAPALALLSTGGALADPAAVERRLATLPACAVRRLPAEHWIPTEQPEAMRRAIEEWCAALDRP